jgi:putative oxidoreductase
MSTTTTTQQTNNRTTATDLGLFLIRSVLAAVFIFRGGQKLFGLFGGYGIIGTAGWMASIGIPFPTVSTVLVGATEFFGGTVLLLGTGTRLAAIPMTFAMLVAILTVHGGAFDAQKGGIEFPLTLAVTLAALALTGPGRLTARLIVDAKARRETHGSARPAAA